MIGVQNLMKKHQAVLGEIGNHESRVTAVCGSGRSMRDAGHFASEEIGRRVQTVSDQWSQLKDKALQVRVLFSLFFITLILNFMKFVLFSEETRLGRFSSSPPIFR